MSSYYSVRIWQLKAGCTGAELEALAASGYLEMQRWIPGVEQVSLLRASSGSEYVLTITFVSAAAYTHWRQVERKLPITGSVTPPSSCSGSARVAC